MSIDKAPRKKGCIYKHPHDHECRNQDDMREAAASPSSVDAEADLMAQRRLEAFGTCPDPSAHATPSVDALRAAWTKHRVVANLRRVHGDCDEDCAGDILARLTERSDD